MHETLRRLFVNRSTHIRTFRKMLGIRSPCRILVITAQSGMGKSWLLSMFAHEALTRKLLLVHIDFADRQTYDTFTLIRRCRDALGQQYFESVHRAIIEAAQIRLTLAGPGSEQAAAVNVSIGSSNVLDTSTITITDVGNTILKDNAFVIQGDVPLQRQAIEDQLNTTFFDCLTKLCARVRVVFLFDSYELTSVHAEQWLPTAADQWIVHELLQRIRDGRLPNAIVVLAGRHTRRFGVEWNHVLHTVSLGPLASSDFKEYLCKRLGLAMITDGEIHRLWQAGAGAPQLLGLFGDQLTRAIRASPSSDDEEWRWRI